MDWLRRIWSSKVDLFGRPSSSTILNEADLKSAVPSILLPDLLTIVIAYAAESAYTWPISTAGDCSADGNVVRVFGRWRAVASQSIVEGSNRWRIRIGFDDRTSSTAAVGISSATPGWSEPDDNADIVVGTSRSYWSASWTNANDVWINGNGYMQPTGYLQSTTRDAVVLVAVDWPRRMMDVVFQDDSKTIRTVHVSIPANGNVVYRPCVVVDGVASATILSG